MTLEHLVGSLTFWARRWPDRLAFWCDGVTLTWGELDKRSDEIAAGLSLAGIGPGDAIGVLMHNRLEFIETMFGAFKAGAAVVLLNIRYTAAEMLHPIRDASVSIVVADQIFLPVLEGVRGEVSDLQVFLTEPVEGYATLSQLKVAGASAPAVELNGTDTALICYTSGTTGVPKGAMLSHFSIYSGAAARSFATGLNFRDRILLPMPLAYTGGAVLMIRDGVVPGSTFYITNQITAGNLLDLIGRNKITMMAGVATLFEKMMEHPDFDATDLSSLTHATTGGAVVTQHLLDTWRNRGVQLTQSFGQTESAGTFMTMLYPDEAERKAGFAGRAMPHVQIKIVDQDGLELPPNTTGEIVVKSPAVMTGYLNQPEQTSNTLRDGWLWTGDIGLLDEEGYLKIVDRSKDMLISGGLNVYPAELEQALAGKAGLEEFAVIGVPDEKWGEVPMIIVPSLACIDIEELKSLSRQKLADFKRPKYITAYGEELPRTFSGKIRKPELRERFQKLPIERVDLKERNS